METIKLTEKSLEVFNYVKDNGGKVSIPELAGALGRTERSVGANVTDLGKKQLTERVKEAVDGNDVTFVSIIAPEAVVELKDAK